MSKRISVAKRASKLCSIKTLFPIEGQNNKRRGGGEKKNEITPWRGSIIQSFKPRDKRPIKLSNQSRLNGSLSASARITLKLIFAFRKIDIRLTIITRAIDRRSKTATRFFLEQRFELQLLAARIMRCVYRCLMRKRWNSDVGYRARTGAVTATGSSVSAIPARLSTAFNNPDFIPRVWKGRSSVATWFRFILFPTRAVQSVHWNGNFHGIEPPLSPANLSLDFGYRCSDKGELYKNNRRKRIHLIVRSQFATKLIKTGLTLNYDSHSDTWTRHEHLPL